MSASDLKVISMSRETYTEPTEGMDSLMFVPFGNDNQYPETLKKLFEQSSLHSSLVKSISQMIAGNGVYIEGYTGDVDDVVVIKNKYGKGLRAIIAATTFQLKLHGYVYWEVIKRGSYIEINVIPATDMRNWEHPFGTMPTKFTYEPKYKSFATGVTLPAFDGQEVQSIYYICPQESTLHSYALPDYVGCINDVLTDIASKKDKLNSIENGFFPSTIVNVNRPMAAADRPKFELNFKNSFIGVDGKKYVINYNEDKENAISFDSFEPPNTVEFYKNLTPDVNQAIVVGHRVTSPLLFGVRMDGAGLGSNVDELAAAYSIFSEVVIKPFQMQILEALNEVVNGCTGQDLPFAFNQFKPSILEDKPTDTTMMSAQDYRKVVPVAAIEAILERLEQVGERLEDLIAAGWELSNKEEFEATKLSLADIKAKPNEASFLDDDKYRIRYRYVGPRDNRNRTFCARVLDLDLMYRKEDIDQMSIKGANEEFGIYDIFQYKGNINCRHNWEEVYLKRKVDGTEKQLVTKPKINSFVRGLFGQRGFFNLIRK